MFQRSHAPFDDVQAGKVVMCRLMRKVNTATVTEQDMTIALGEELPAVLRGHRAADRQSTIQKGDLARLQANMDAASSAALCQAHVARVRTASRYQVPAIVDRDALEVHAETH